MSSTPAQHGDVAALRAAIARGDIVVGKWLTPMDTVRMMSRLLRGQNAAYDCPIRMWPQWLQKFHSPFLYDPFNCRAHIGGVVDYSIDLAFVSHPSIDFEYARDRFLYHLLLDGELSGLEATRLTNIHLNRPDDFEEIEALSAVLGDRFIHGKPLSITSKHYDSYQRGISLFLKKEHNFVRGIAINCARVDRIGQIPIRRANVKFFFEQARNKMITALSEARTG